MPGGSRRGGDEAEQEQGAHHLGRLGGGHAGQGQEPEPKRGHGQAPGPGDRLVDGGEQQRPRDQEEHHHGPGADDGRLEGVAAGQAEHRPEEHRHAGRTVGRRPRARVEGEEQHPQAKDPREDGADHHVVGPAPGAEQAHPDGDADGGHEEPEAGVDPEGQGRHGARHRDVGQGVGGEHLRPQYEEVARQARRRRHRRPRKEGVPHEGIRQHVGDAGQGVHARLLDGPRRPSRRRIEFPRRPSRRRIEFRRVAISARANRANPNVVTKKPIG